jgi:hypothetical protein
MKTDRGIIKSNKRDIEYNKSKHEFENYILILDTIGDQNIDMNVLHQ